MNITCIWQGHIARDHGVWNQGYCFSQCRRCSIDLIRTSDDWHRVPRGYRVAWHRAHHAHAIPSEFKRNLPLLVNRRPRWALAWKLGRHHRGVGCIMLPVDNACRDETPIQGPAFATMVVASMILLVGTLLNLVTPRSSAMRGGGTPT